MHFISISTIPLALALVVTTSSILSVSAAPDSVAIVEPSENNQAQFDHEAPTGRTLPANPAPGFTTRRNKARGRALMEAKITATANTAVAGRDATPPEAGVPDSTGYTTEDGEAFNAWAKWMCPHESTVCNLT